LRHFAQAKIRLPDGNLKYCKFGFCFLFVVGLNFPLNFILLKTLNFPFPQIWQILLIKL